LPASSHLALQLLCISALGLSPKSIDTKAAKALTDAGHTPNVGISSAIARDTKRIADCGSAVPLAPLPRSRDLRVAARRKENPGQSAVFCDGDEVVGGGWIV